MVRINFRFGCYSCGRVNIAKSICLSFKREKKRCLFCSYFSAQKQQNDKVRDAR